MEKPKVNITISWSKDLKRIHAVVVFGLITAHYEEKASANSLKSTLFYILETIFRQHGHQVTIEIDDQTIPN